MKANAAMTRNVVCVGPDDTLLDAYEIMTEWEIRHLPVLRGNELVGILSDRDVILHSTRNPLGGIDVPSIPLSVAMTENPLTCGLVTDIARLAETMLDHKIDSIPVMGDDGALLGLVTSSDLLQILADKERVTKRHALPFAWKVYTGARPGMAINHA